MTWWPVLVFVAGVVVGLVAAVGLAAVAIGRDEAG